MSKNGGFNWLMFLLCAMFTSGVTIGLLLLLAFHFFDLELISNASCSKASDFVYCFYDDEWDSATYLSLITSFYSTIIAFLIVIITLVSGIAYFAVKNSHSQQIEESVQGELPRFFEKVKSEELLKKILETSVHSEFEILEGRINRLDEKLEQFKDRINAEFELDNDDKEGTLTE